MAIWSAPGRCGQRAGIAVSAMAMIRFSTLGPSMATTIRTQDQGRKGEQHVIGLHHDYVRPCRRNSGHEADRGAMTMAIPIATMPMVSEIRAPTHMIRGKDVAHPKESVRTGNPHSAPFKPVEHVLIERVVWRDHRGEQRQKADETNSPGRSTTFLVGIELPSGARRRQRLRSCAK